MALAYDDLRAECTSTYRVTVREYQLLNACSSVCELLGAHF
jgi:hypothetical protein